MKSLFSLALAALGWMTLSDAVAQDTLAPATIQISGPVLRVKDIDASLKFYVDGLGLNAQRRGPSMVILTSAGTSTTPFIILNQIASTRGSYAPPIQIGNGLSRIFLLSSDITGLHSKLGAAGFTPTAISARSNVFFVTDPDGWRYEITNGSRSTSGSGVNGCSTNTSPAGHVNVSSPSYAGQQRHRVSTA